MKLTQDQENAASGLLEWYKKPYFGSPSAENLFYLIDGAAGTGKTTVTKQVIESLGVPKHRLAVTAPTHQAKKVIQNATGFTASTIQSLLGLRPNVELDNFDIRNPQFDPLAEESIKDFKVIMIDESSMLSKDAFDLILQKAIQHKVKVIFLGDSYQLPPVKETMGKVFTDVVNRSTLREVVRQSDDNPNTNFLLGIRADIDKKQPYNLFKAIQQSNMINDKGYQCLNNVDFGQQMLNYFGSTIAGEDPNHMRYVTWTNKSVEAWCTFIREQLIENSNRLINVGENLIGYNTIQVFPENRLVLQNSEMYKVTSVEESTSSFDENITGYTIVIKDTDGEEFEHFLVGKDGFETFRDIAYEKWKDAREAPYFERKKKWAAFYSFKNKHLTFQDTYYQGMPIKKDLYYSYGMTVHKSQGSTITNVAINLIDILRNPKMSEKLRLAYVALSRCKETNLILTK